MGLVLRRKNTNLVLIDGIFWFFIGIPLVWLLYSRVLHMEDIHMRLVMLKEAVNGIFNALLASLILTYVPVQAWTGRSVTDAPLSLHQTLFSLLVGSILFPTLLLTTLESRQEMNKMATEIKARLEQESIQLADSLRLWQQQHLRAVTELAQIAAESAMIPSDALQQSTKFMQRAFPDFHLAYIANAEGTAIAFYPPTNEKGESNLGLNFADRFYFDELKAALQPVVSDVFMEPMGAPRPVITLTVPVLAKNCLPGSSWSTAENCFRGFSFGSLELGHIGKLLKSVPRDKGLQSTLLDRKGRIIASTEADRAPMQDFDRRKGGEIRPLGGALYQWLPMGENLPTMVRWEKSLYAQEVVIGEDIPWTLVVEEPLAPYYRLVESICINNLAIMLVLAVPTLILSASISHRLASPLSKLAEVTTDLSDKLLDPEGVNWPSGSVAEMDSLVGNFKVMVHALRQNFQDIQSANEQLKERTQELSKANRTLENEIVERKRAEEELERSNQRVVNILEGITDAFIAYDHQWRFTYLNTKAVQLLGKTREELLGKCVWEEFPEDVGSVLYKEYHRAVSEQVAVECEQFYLLTNTWFEVRAYPSQEGLSVYFHDITRRKWTEEKICQQNEYLTALHETALALMNRLELEDLLEAIVIRAGALVGTPHGYIYLLEEGEAEMKKQVGVGAYSKFIGYRLKPGEGVAGKVWQTGRPLVVGDYRTWPDRLPDADLDIFCATVGVPLKSGLRTCPEKGERIVGVLGLAHFEEGRTFGEEEVMLLSRFAELVSIALDNARLYAEIQEADRRKDRFLAMLGHELRNPLAPILHAAQLARLHGTDDPTLQSMVEVVERQAQHMARLVDDLLDVSRIRQGKVQLRKEPLDLATVLNQAAQMSRPFIEAQRHRLSVSLPQKPVHLEADPVRLEQILVNLLNNAAKYTEPGGHIWLSGAQEGEEVVFRVRDTGIGVPPEMLPRIFDLFTQVDQTLARSQGGLGIGLTLVHNLVEMHGGRVSAHSAGLGQGSEFVVRLPALSEVREPGGAEVQEKEDGDVAAPPLRRVLVVDDNVDAVKILGELLKGWGYEVQVMHDGPTAIETALAYPPDVVLLDIGLPGMDGYEVAQALRQQASLSKTVLVALTGYGQEEERARAREAGFDYHFTKPVNLAALRKVLSTESF